jgi:dipeptidyl aminopeptidase/acylaminoacyl peptidase
MTFRTVIASLSMATCTACGAQAASVAPRTPITHETLWMMKRVSAPVVSPDGRWAVVSIVEPSYQPDKVVSDLWLMSVDGSKPLRRLTNSKAPEGGVSWSPDSDRIAFSTRREGDEIEQIYVLSVTKGDPGERLTNMSTGAVNPKWRPDGEAILFESMVYPRAVDDDANRKAVAEKKALKYNVRAYEHLPIRHWTEWLDERQPTIMVQALKPGSVAKDLLAPTALANTSGFSGHEAPTDNGVSLAPLWSPDGSEILFTATTERWNAAFGRVGYRIYRMAADGGEPRIVVPTAGDYNDVTFSPDGKALFFKYTVQDEEAYHLARLQRVSWPGGGAALLVARDFDREVARYAVTPDGKTAYLLVPEAGKENLYRVAAKGGKPTLAIEPAMGGYTALSIPPKAAAPVLVGVYGSSVSPSEVVRIEPRKRAHVNLTAENVAAAAAIDWKPPEHFYFKSAGGRSIHNMIVLPPAFDPARKYPLVVLIHGGAAYNNEDQITLRMDYHLLIRAGYVLLMTDYTGSTSFGEAFAQAIRLDPLKTPAKEIDQAVDEALKRYSFIDGARTCVVGASYGAFLANWIEATTTRYKCIVSHAGEVDLLTQWGTSDVAPYRREMEYGGPPWDGNPLWKGQSAISQGAAWKTPMLLSVGERDFRVPIGNTLENWSALQRMKVPSRLLIWPDAGHWITKPEDSRHFYEEVDAWLAKYLKADSPDPVTAAPRR